LKFPVKIYSPRWKRSEGTTLSLLPELVTAMGLPPGVPLSAVVDRETLILCRPERARVWEKVLAGNPARFIRAASRRR
jgi:hypothetical protein